ncbi:MAG: AAA family ATPase [Rubrivivax sp.]
MPQPVRPRLQLAGPPQLRLGPQALATGTRKALALALLAALEPGLRRSRAADLLWPDADPAAARRNLRRDLFRLRQGGLALDDGPGETLALADCEIDWPAPGLLPPPWLEGLDEVAGAELSHWVALQRRQLQRRWIAQLAEAARGLEAAGHDAQALQAWRALLADGAAGPGHAEARAALQRLRPGAEPPEALHEHGLTHELMQAPSPDRSAAAPRPLRTATLPFVGREPERMAIVLALAERRLVLLDGSPGIGKTRLALEALAARGGVLLLRCRPEDAAVPYASALRGLQTLRDAAPGVVLPPRLRRELGFLLADAAAPALSLHAADAAPNALRLRRAYHEALALLAAGNFGAVVIDDWQWADEPSQALWDGPDDDRRDAGALPTVVVHRSGELPPAALQRRRQWLDSGRAVAVRVPPLAEAGLRQLLQALGADDADGPRLLQACAGNPLFLIETLRHQWRGGGSAALPGSVHEVIVARARALGPAVRRVLEAASLAGDALPPRELAAAAGVAELAVAQALEHAATAELLEPDGQGRGGYRFAHDLIAQAIADSLSPVRRQALHAQLALAAAGDAEPGRVARHLQLAGRDGEAAPWLLRAAEVAFQRQAWPQALDGCRAVLSISRDSALRLQARLLASRTLRRQAEPAAAEAELQSALADAARAGAAAVIDLALERAEALNAGGRADAALAELQPLPADPALTPAQRRRLLQEQASALSMQGRHDESLPRLQALLAAVPASQPHERRRVLSLLSRNSYWAGRLDDAREQVGQMLAISRRLSDGASEASGLFRLGVLDREAGRTDEAVARLQAAIALARQEGHVELLRSALATLASIRLDRLQLDEAQALIEAGEQAAPGWDSADLEDVFDERRHRLHLLRGEVDAAWAVMRRSLARHAAHDHLHSELGTLLQTVELALATGDAALARRQLDAAAALHRRGGGADSLHGAELEVRTVQVLRAEGHAAEALARAEAWLAQPLTRRVHERALLLMTGAAAALDLGRAAAAAPLLQQALALPGLDRQLEGRLLALRLRHARAGGEPAAPVLAAVDAWLAQPVQPALEAAALRSALDDVGLSS